MSRPNATETEAKVRATKSSTDVLGIPAISREDNADSQTLYSDNTVAGATKRDRLSGAGKSGNKDNKLALLTLLGGTNSLTDITFSAPSDETAQEQTSVLTTATQAVVGALGASLGLLSLQAAFIGGETAIDTRQHLKNKAATRVATEEAAEKAVKSGAEAATKSGAEAVAKIATEEGTEAALKYAGREALETAAKSGLKLGAKHIPLTGAVITATFAAHEVSSFWSEGEHGKAIAAGFVGAAETAGNLFTFGFLGDVFREGARGIVLFAGGEEYEDIAKSDIRSLVEAGIEFKSQFAEAAAAPQTQFAAVPIRGFTPSTLANA